MTRPSHETRRPLIERHGPDGFQIAGHIYQSAVLVLPTRVMVWPVDDLFAVTDSSLAAVVEHGMIDLVLIGTGARLVRLQNLSRPALKAHGIGFDPMDSASACRTYNILVQEGRRVAAAILPIRYQAAT